MFGIEPEIVFDQSGYPGGQIHRLVVGGGVRPGLADPETDETGRQHTEEEERRGQNPCCPGPAVSMVWPERVVLISRGRHQREVTRGLCHEVGWAMLPHPGTYSS